ncbi:MAG: DUF4340 domain-containing protein [Myxococcaceae bacterium]
MKKATLVVVGVFAALLIAVFATRGSQVSVGVKKLALPKLDKSKVTQLSVSGPKNAVLKKEGDAWKVDGHAAETSQVEAAIDAINELKDAEFLSDRADKQAGYELDDAKGLKLAVEEGGAKKVDVVLGKASQNGGFYLRKAGSDDVFVYRGRLDYTVRKNADEWRKKQILSLKAEDIQRLILKSKSGAETKVAAGDAPNKWTLEAPAAPANFRFDPSAPQQIAAQLSSLTAQGFLEGADAADDKTGLGGPHDSVEAELKDGKKVGVHLGAQPDASNSAGTVAAKVDGDPQVYQLPQWIGTSLRKQLPELRDTSLFTFDPAKVKAVRLVAGAKKAVLVKDASGWKVQEPKQLPSGFEFDPQQVENQLAMLRGMRAVKVVDTPVSDARGGFGAPIATVIIEQEGAPTETLKLGKAAPMDAGQTTANLYARGSADRNAFLVTDYVKNRLTSGIELFKKQPPPSFGGPGGMKGLESLPPDVRRQLEAQLRARQ